jgi:CHAD domain-containing protein
VRKTIERELKLVPGEDFRLADLGEPSTRVFMSTYHDTADLELARHGITLRNRVEEGTRLWQLKIPTGDSRFELEIPGPPAQLPQEMTDLLVAYLRDGRELVKVARLRTRRQSVVKDGAEIVEDAVSVFEAQRVTHRFRELEVELLDGDERALRNLERELRRAGAARGPFVPKVFRALEIPFDAEPRRIPSDASPGEALGLALAAQHHSLLAHDPGTRLGADPEDLHQMRVATRRARAFLRAARVLVDPSWAERLRAELGWLGSALGPARDADVLLDHLQREIDAVGVPPDQGAALLKALEGQRDRTRRRARTALSAQRYFRLLRSLEQAAEPRLAHEATATLAELWWQEFGRTRRAFERLDRRSSDAELHAARIRVKRARYSAELAAHELGDPGLSFIEAAKQVQDILGAYQDAVVAEAYLQSWLQRNPKAVVAVLALHDAERKRRKRARREWPDAWKRLLRRARAARP